MSITSNQTIDNAEATAALNGKASNGKSKQFYIATHYTTHGLTITPVKADGTKAPILLEWQLRGMPTADDCHEWYDRANPLGIGIVCGAVSGNLCCLDFEYREFFEQWREVTEPLVPGLIQKLPRVKTPGKNADGGVHLYFRTATEQAKKPGLAMMTKVEAKRRTGDERRTTKVELLAKGCQALAPGCPPKCHPSGREYEHVAGPNIYDAPILTNEEFKILYQAAQSLHEGEPEKTKAAPAAYKGDGAPRPGDDFDLRGPAWRDLLEPHGWTLISENGDVQRWKRPGKTEPGISATTGHCKGNNGEPLLHVFSSNAPLPEGTYGKFRAVTFLEYKGEYKDAARELGKQGYGSPPSRNGRIVATTADTSTPAARPNEQRSVTGNDLEPAESAPPSAEQQTESSQTQPAVVLEPLTLGNLITQNPRLREPVVEGLLRIGETMNIISVSKVGKSWLTIALAIAVATGRHWLDVFKVMIGNVLMIDNELHATILANRIPKVAEALGVGLDEINDRIHVLPLRGRLMDLVALETFFGAIVPGTYKLIVIDAFYRSLPEKTDENSNAAMAMLYNRIDRYAEMTGAAFVLIHHASKGNQAQKNLVDVGAGAGAQSRATDCHLILRPHEEQDVVVLEAAVRSFAPVDPICLRWQFPLWTRADDLDPALLKGALKGQSQADKDKERNVKIEADARSILHAHAINDPGNDGLTKNKLEDASGFGPSRFGAALTWAKEYGQLREDDGIVEIGHKAKRRFKVLKRVTDEGLLNIHPEHSPDRVSEC